MGGATCLALQYDIRFTEYFHRRRLNTFQLEGEGEEELSALPKFGASYGEGQLRPGHPYTILLVANSCHIVTAFVKLIIIIKYNTIHIRE